MRKKGILFAGLLVCLLAGAWAYYNYQKPRTGVSYVDAAYTLSAEELYAVFSENEASATEKYAGKVIAVKGVVREVAQSENGILILLQVNNAPGGISCSMAKAENLPLPEVGTMATLKGRCTGFLMDVNLVDVVLIK